MRRSAFSREVRGAFALSLSSLPCHFPPVFFCVVLRSFLSLAFLLLFSLVHASYLPLRSVEVLDSRIHHNHIISVSKRQRRPRV